MPLAKVIAERPDVSDDAANAVRRHVLAAYRGYPAGDVFTGMPGQWAVVQDTVDGIDLAKSTPRKDQKNDSCNRGKESGELSIAHAEDHSWIDADEFDQKALDPKKHQEFAGNHAGCQRMLQAPLSSAP